MYGKLTSVSEVMKFATKKFHRFSFVGTTVSNTLAPEVGESNSRAVKLKEPGYFWYVVNFQKSRNYFELKI